MGKKALFAALLLGISGVAQAQEASSALIFAKSVFRTEAAGGVDDFSRFFTARFRKAVDLDRPEGEVGLLDHDPICLCQDSDGMHFSVLTIRKTQNGVNITVRAGRKIGHWQLVREGGNWKIADISEANWMNGSSILKALEREQKRRH